MFENYRDVVTVEDLCEMLSIGKNKAYSLISSGQIKSFKIGKVNKIPKAWVIEYINSQSL